MRKFHSSFAAVLLLSLLVPTLTRAQPVPLNSTWGEYDLEQEKGQSTDGLVVLSGQSASGYTAFVKSNVLNATVSDFPPKSQYLPRIFQTFPGQPITNFGSKVTVSFDVTVNTPVPAPSNVGFRMSMGDTNANNAIVAGFDFGNSAGGSVLLRYDITITQNTNWFDPNTGFYLFTSTNRDYAWGSLTDAGPNLSTSGTTAGAPNGASLQPGATHNFKFSIERVPNGLMVGTIWGNDAGPEVISTAGNPLASGIGDDNNGLTDTRPWTGINCFGICLFGTGSNPVSWDENGGSYTVSNFKIYSGLNISEVKKEGDDLILTWESNPLDTLNGALYDVQYTTNLSSPEWVSLANTNISADTTFPGGFQTSYTNSAPTDAARFYRVTKIFQ